MIITRKNIKEVLISFSYTFVLKYHSITLCWIHNIEIRFPYDSLFYQLEKITHTFKSFALIDTIIVLKDIKAAPNAGLNKIPRENNTPAANGIAIILYPVAHQRF